MERYVLDIKGKDVLYFILLFKTLLMLCLISNLASLLFTFYIIVAPDHY